MLFFYLTFIFSIQLCLYNKDQKYSYTKNSFTKKYIDKNTYLLNILPTKREAAIIPAS